jgi:hypothetical protein
VAAEPRERRGRRTLARDVAHRERRNPVVELHDVVEVPTDVDRGVRGPVARDELEAVDLRQPVRQEARLQNTSHLHLLLVEPRVVQREGRAAREVLREGELVDAVRALVGQAGQRQDADGPPTRPQWDEHPTSARAAVVLPEEVVDTLAEHGSAARVHDLRAARAQHPGHGVLLPDRHRVPRWERQEPALELGVHRGGRDAPRLAVLDGLDEADVAQVRDGELRERFEGRAQVKARVERGGGRREEGGALLRGLGGPAGALLEREELVADPVGRHVELHAHAAHELPALVVHGRDVELVEERRPVLAVVHELDAHGPVVAQGRADALDLVAVGALRPGGSGSSARRSPPRRSRSSPGRSGSRRRWGRRRGAGRSGRSRCR